MPHLYFRPQQALDDRLSAATGRPFVSCHNPLTDDEALNKGGPTFMVGGSDGAQVHQLPEIDNETSKWDGISVQENDSRLSMILNDSKQNGAMETEPSDPPMRRASDDNGDAIFQVGACDLCRY